MSYAITASGLCRTFGSVVAVDGIDLDVPTGQIYGFLGPNGSGKSTTIRMMCGLLKPTAGEITVLGHDALAEAETVRRQLGYMTQRFSLWEDLTVRENLLFMCRVYGLSRRASRERVAARIEEYHLGDFAGRRPEVGPSFSDGDYGIDAIVARRNIERREFAEYADV